MNIHEQLNVLIKAAEDNRVTTRKLVAAAKVVGDAIEDHVPVGVPLPRTYQRVRFGNSNNGYATFLRVGCGCGPDAWECHHATGEVNCDVSGYLFGDFQLPELEKTGRAVALRFAKDVADGLIGEIAEMLQNRATANDAAIATLTAASDALSRDSDKASLTLVSV